MTYKEAIEYLKWKSFQDYSGTPYELAIEALEKQIPKKPYKDRENGVYYKEHCPCCGRSLFPNDHHCVCGQAIDWSDN